MQSLTARDLTAETRSGLVRGVQEGLTSHWLGIPYADPPVGPHRWRAPRPVMPWTGIRDATAFGSVAPQPKSAFIPIPPGLSENEDCLTLNVWAPAEARFDGRPRPVMVWVHGGGYVLGSSAQPITNPSKLVERGDVVVVTLNYRLGPLGFLDFTSLSRGADRFESNLGLRDVIAALKWVRDNIAFFGGDPKQVTLFGQSAGASIVTTLMTVPIARGLFHRAIAQSPPATSVYLPERADRAARLYLELLQVREQDAAHELATRPFAELVSQTMSLMNSISTNSPGVLAFAPVVDGILVPEHPIEAFERGAQHRVPLIIGSTRDEGVLFKMMESPLLPADSEAVGRMFEGLRAEHDLTVNATTITAAYPDFPTQKGAIQISGDAGIGMPVTWVAQAHASVAPTYVYRFDQATPLLKLSKIGATHASEIAYVFGTLPDRARLNRQQSLWFGGLTTARSVSQRMQDRWLSFAAANHDPSWPEYDLADRATLIMNKRDIVAFDPLASRRIAWGMKPIGFL